MTEVRPGRSAEQRDGPSRARTGGLQSARLTLSQLSYGPSEPVDCSPEFVVTTPTNTELLVVPGVGDPQMGLPNTCEVFEREQKALFELRAEDAVQLEFTGEVSAIDETIPAAATGVQPTHDHVALQPRELALDAIQGGTKVENQVIPLVVQGTRDSNRPSSALESDRCLRYKPELVRRQHRQQRYC